MRVLITGANGFIGKNLALYLESQGYEVIRTDVSDSQINGDIASPEFVFNSLGGLEFDAIVHLAAITDIRKTLEDLYSCYRVNAFGTLSMLEVAAKKMVKRFIYASSANYYGLPLELPVKETTPPNPRTPYDYSKVVGENLVKSYIVHRDLKAVVLRSWKLFGEHDVATTAIPRFINACLRNEDIPLFNGGLDVTDPIYIRNYCEIVKLCLERNDAVGEAFNVGSGNRFSIREIAETVKELTGSKSKVNLLPPRSAAEATPMESYPSIEKLREKLGYTPSIGFREGLRRTIDWYSSRINSQ